MFSSKPVDQSRSDLVMTSSDLWRRDAVSLSTLLDQGAVDAVELLDHFMKRCERLEPTLNAFAYLDRVGAKRAAEAAAARRRAGGRLGPLDGIPVAIKDNLFVRGMPAVWGSLLFRDHEPDDDDIAIERLRAAGAVILGKTTTPELSASGRTESPVTGSTRNPWNPTLTSGGSSGGSVAAVAAGMVPLALGTDAGGSTRMPASYNGILGLRPSNGRIPRRYGFPPLSLDFQTIGLFARTTADLGQLYRVVAGGDPRDPASLRVIDVTPARKARIGWFADMDGVSPDAAVEAALREAARHFADLGHQVRPATPPFSARALQPIWDTLTAAGAARIARRFPDRWQSEMGEALAEHARRGLSLSAADYVEALDGLTSFRAETSSRWGEFDALLTPTTPAPAWPADQLCPSDIGGRKGSVEVQGMFCGAVNAMGYPALSIPAGRHADGRPIGIQLIAPFGAEATLMALASDVEQVAPWARTWPAMAEAA